jgi:serine/threonine protein kinase
MSLQLSADLGVQVWLVDRSANGVWVNAAASALGRGNRHLLAHRDVVTLLRLPGAVHIKFQLRVEGDLRRVRAHQQQLQQQQQQQQRKKAEAASSEPGGRTASTGTASDTATTTSAGSTPASSSSASSSTASGAGIQRREGRVFAPVGRRVEADYEFHEVLGTGNYGVVHAATERATGRAVAIKEIDVAGSLQQSDQYQKTGFNPILEEIRVLSRLRHKNIVKLLRVYWPAGSREMESGKGSGAASSESASAAEGKCYIVQELINSGELFLKIEAKGRYSEVHAKGLFQQVLTGVAYLHSQGVVHRDIKPENLLLMAYQRIVADASPSAAKGAIALGQRFYTVKLADFGMARMSRDRNLSAYPSLRETEKAEAPQGVHPAAEQQKPGDEGDAIITLDQSPTTAKRVGRFHTIAGTEPYLALEIRMLHDNVSEEALRTAFTLWVRRRLEAKKTDARPEATMADRKQWQPMLDFLSGSTASVATDVEGASGAAAVAAWEQAGQTAEHAGSKRCRADDVDSAYTGPLPPGMNFLPSQKDYEDIKSSLVDGYDAAVDSWSIGVVLFACLVGEMPFYADKGRLPILFQMLTSYLDSRFWQSGGISEEAKDLILSLLHPNPRKRLLPKDALKHPWFASTGSAN